MIRIGVICPSEIAFRRFMPALKNIKGFEFVGLAVCTKTERFGDQISKISSEVIEKELKIDRDKALSFVKTYGGKIFEGYCTIVTSDEIDALYIPLPPALHFKWAKFALENGKHVLIEKPSTISSKTTKELVNLAEEKGLALHENYMFAFHNQLAIINNIISSGEIGDVRLYRISFGFPRRNSKDFRYNKSLGGGSLIDAGGYTIKYATMLLGETARVAYAHLNYINDFEVDVYGSGAMINEKGATVQIAFGMDNNYKCELEVWGSKGSLTTGRVLTAPADFIPEMNINKGNINEVRKLPSDDTFSKSIMRFQECITDSYKRKVNYKEIVKQADLVDEFLNIAEYQNRSLCD